MGTSFLRVLKDFIVFIQFNTSTQAQNSSKIASRRGASAHPRWCFDLSGDMRLFQICYYLLLLLVTFRCCIFGVLDGNTLRKPLKETLFKRKSVY